MWASPLNLNRPFHPRLLYIFPNSPPILSSSSPSLKPFPPYKITKTSLISLSSKNSSMACLSIVSKEVLIKSSLWSTCPNKLLFLSLSLAIFAPYYSWHSLSLSLYQNCMPFSWYVVKVLQNQSKHFLSLIMYVFSFPQEEEKKKKEDQYFHIGIASIWKYSLVLI